MQVGKQSLRFAEAPFIVGSASIVGTREAAGPLGDCFDVVGCDDKFGQDTWEQAESALQNEALAMAVGKSNLTFSDIRYLFGGDLLGQNMATTFGVKGYKIPLFGLYGACSTCGEALSLAAMTVAADYAEYTAAVTSSHFASAEKQFRFPLQYAATRSDCATWTVTGSASYVIGRHKGNISGKCARITEITTGRIIDFGIKDSMNMGAVMAPAACDVIAANLDDFGREASYYDLIITGDLGTVGRKILIDLMSEKGHDISRNHEDCGIKIFDASAQGTGAGGSGCACSAVTFASYYLPRIIAGELRRVLFVPTGALLSPVSFNEGMSVPGIAHAVVVESEGF